MRRIQDRFAESDRVPVANSVYLALALIASDMQCEEFTVKIALIASRAGVSYKTALGYLRELEAAGIVGIRRSKVEGTKLDAPSMYSLFSVCRDDTALCRNVTALCSKGFDPSVTEKVEESEKKPPKNTRTPAAAGSLNIAGKTFSSELVLRIYESYPRKKRLADKPTPREARAIRKGLSTLAEIELDAAATMLERVGGYALHARRQPPQFVKTLINYMRDDHFFNVFTLRP